MHNWGFGVYKGSEMFGNGVMGSYNGLFGGGSKVKLGLAWFHRGLKLARQDAWSLGLDGNANSELKS